MSKKIISLFPCGIKVRMILSGIEGMITCSSIRFDKVQYEVSYFIEGKHETVWMNENEFETNNQKVKIGFKSLES